MKYHNIFLLLFSLTSTAQGVDVHYYYCKNEHLELSLFLMPHNEDNYLGIVLDGKQINFDTVSTENLLKNIRVNARKTKNQRQFSLTLAVPENKIAPFDKDEIDDIDHGQPFRSTVSIHDKSSRHLYEVDCEAFGLSYELIDLISGSIL